MVAGLLGSKVGMTQIYDAAGAEVPVTVVKVGPCAVLQVRTVAKDGYEAVQLGFGAKPRRLCSRSESGHVAGVLSGLVEKSVLSGGDGAFRFVREFRTEGGGAQPAVGDVLTAGEFAEVAHVDVTGVSKGRGFAGVMKRHNFGGVCASHGVKKVHRSGGSTGQSTDPGKVFKGTKMPGRYGGKRATVRRMKVVSVDADRNLLLIRGAVPGFSGGYVMVRPTNCY
ncbi:50S ribosomal protein L3 [Schlesneria paludicola]|uniref:50S ribosomal protein L3 n=1 Tax=Schlesneria paludicola TaxID=360056 RepID=UPI00029A375B|nr:50S ribosomal protein L3 [Schlesneria paludicola]